LEFLIPWNLNNLQEKTLRKELKIGFSLLFDI
jgi:hypothetical protein